MKQFAKFWFVQQLPIYGFYMWAFIQFGADYWTSWFLANNLYALTMYPVMKKKVFI